MVIDDFNVVGVAIFESENNASRAADVDGPELATLTLQLVQAEAFQWAQIAQRSGGVKLGQAGLSLRDIKPGKFALAGFEELAAGALVPRLDHLRIV